MSESRLPDEVTIHLAEDRFAEEGPNAPMYAWFQLFKTAQIHAITNQAMERPLAAMVHTTESLLDTDGKFALQTHDGAVFVNGIKLKLGGDELDFADDVIEFFDHRGLGGFTIEAPLTEDDVRALLQILVYAPPEERTFADIDQAIGNAGLPIWVMRPSAVVRKTDTEIQLERRNTAFFTYSKLRVLFNEIDPDSRVIAKRHSFMRKIHRVIQSLVDLCLDDAAALLALASVRDMDDYVSCHAINSAIFSIALGARLGFSKADLADLGLAAVFHDVGLRSVASDVLDKQSTLDASERATVNRHVLRSVAFLLSERKFHRSALSRIVVAYEHHRPSAPPAGTRPPDLLTKIVTIASVFDALATHRPWRAALPADQVLAIMMSDAGEMFDAVLLKEFISLVGLYPAGTLLRLEDERLAVSLGRSAGNVARPYAATLNEDGTYGEVLDLDERTPRGRYIYRIASVEDPMEYGFRASGLVANAPPRPLPVVET